MIIKNSFMHDQQRYPNDYSRDKAIFEQLSADLTKAGIENKFTYIGNGSSSGQYITVTTASDVQKYNIEWITAVYNGGNYKNYDVSNSSSSYDTKLNMWLEFQLNGVKYLLGTTNYSSITTTYAYFYLYTDATSKPNTEGNTIENFYLRRFNRLSHYYYMGKYDSSSYIPSWTITKFNDNVFIEFGTNNYKFTMGYMSINEQYGIILPAKDQVFCEYALNGADMVYFTPVTSYNTCLAGDDEGDKLSGTIPMSEMFLGIKDTGVICKFNNIITLPYNYAETRSLKIGNKLYRKVPSFDYCYYVEE